MTTRSAGETPAFNIHHRTGAAMWELDGGVVDLVVTSPPYYPPDIEPALREPLARQLHLDDVAHRIRHYAFTLQPIFSEIARVLKPTGKLVIQTKELRYGGYLVGPLDTHRQIAELAGFHLMTEIAWQCIPGWACRNSTLRSFWSRGHFLAASYEMFLVFSRGSLATRSTAREGLPPEELLEPVWKLPGQGARATHPHESPLSVLRRIVDLYSQPGDLVLDPFCGHGTTLAAGTVRVVGGRRSVAR